VLQSEWEKAIFQNESQELQEKSWLDFANTVGYKELPRLNRMNIAYRIPPPGVR